MSPKRTPISDVHNLHLSHSKRVFEIRGNKRVMELLRTFVKRLNMKAYFTKTTYNKVNMIYACLTRTFLEGRQAKMKSVFPGHTRAYEYNRKRHHFKSDVIFLKNFHTSPQQLANNFFPRI